MNKKAFIFITVLLVQTFVYGQADTADYWAEQQDYFHAGLLQNGDKVLMKDVATVRLKAEGFEMGFPILDLHSDQHLIISLDVLHDKDIYSFYYKIHHCNRNWEQDQLNPGEYLQGTDYGYIDEVSNSINTAIRYMHFEKKLPEDGTTFILSGNYILEIYTDESMEELVARKRFAIKENLVSASIKVKPGTTARTKFTHQEVDFNLNIAALPGIDPFSDLHVVVQQNGRWDNAIKGLKPLFVRGNILEYDYFKENLFYGINEFRPLNIKSVRYQGIKIKTIKTDDTGLPYVYLLPEKSRSFLQYKNQGDINGQYIVMKEYAGNSDLEADYCMVTFQLKTSEIKGATVALFGELSNWDLEDRFTLKYDSVSQSYLGSVLLKQGFYDYFYAVREPGKNTVDCTRIEGTHSETQNMYKVWIYLNDKQKGVDRLVGLEQQLSRN